MLWPTAGVLALGAATIYVAAVDPNQPGHYPLCPLKALTGLDCPACGGLRSVHDLANGDIAGALNQNLLVVVLLPVFVVWMVLALRRRWSGTPRVWTETQVRWYRYLLIGFISLTVIFAVIRNLPFVPFLGSGLS